MVTTSRRGRNTERPFRPSVLVALWILGCGGAAEREASADSELLVCGVLPDTVTCWESPPEAFGSEENPALVCDGWPDNPFGEIDDEAEFFQVVYQNGSRGIVSRINGETVCLDRWK